MELLDIVHRAIRKSGVSSSFNEDEIPEDIEKCGSDILRNEIVPELNCDRTLDLTETVMVFTPVNNQIVLRDVPPEYDRQVVEPVDLPSGILLKGDQYGRATNVIDLLVDLGYIEWNGTGYDRTRKWQSDVFGHYRKMAIWSSDYKLIELPVADNIASWLAEDLHVNRIYNVPFPAMRVVSVTRVTDGVPLDYIHASEMVSAEFRYSALVYTTEDYEDRHRIIFTPNSGQVTVAVVVPVPVRIINTFEEPHPHEGRIIAPRKFRAFLTNILAWRLASEFGVSTKDEMKELTVISYGMLKRNLSKEMHKQDTDRRINAYLERGRGTSTRGRYGSGYNG